ncbi:UNVERIFIED_CONTAM: hypothetical protein Sindi_1276600 [Sesamum indicum]
MDSIEVLKRGLDRFAVWSGLRLNVQKSHLIISRSAQGLREEMLEALGFQEGLLPLRPVDEGGLGFKDITTLNRALMTKKLCDIIQCDRTSIWVEWLYHDRLRDTSIWTIRHHGGSWSWRKLLRLWIFLHPMVDYQIRDGRKFHLWQDPWHYLGPLIEIFPRGPRLLRLEESAKLSTVISGGEWQWPLITDFECFEITHVLPTIRGGDDRIVWRFDQG